MNVLDWAYQYLFKKIAFRLDPEMVHDHVLVMGKWLGKCKVTRSLIARLLAYRAKSLEQEILGIHFPNPIGLSAGFDKNAELLDILPSVGFGFVEIGSITGEPCLGNPKKRLWRLLKSKSLLVYYGLKNDGAEIISQRLKHKNFLIPVGISVAKTNSPDTVELQAGIADYVKAHRLTAEIGSYTTINISCPNAYGGQPFTEPERLGKLLQAIDEVKSSKPIFVKFSADLSDPQVDALLKVIGLHKVAGIICTNLTKNRELTSIKDQQIPDVGGMSGKVVEDLSNHLLEYVYRKTQGQYILIGVGGIFSANDAYKKIRLGASLVQLITGMIYEGPQLIGQVNRDLVKLLQRDGFSNVSEAIGIDVKVG